MNKNKNQDKLRPDYFVTTHKQIDFEAQQNVKKKKGLYKFNLAKETIRIFNHLRNDIQQIRSPFAFEGGTNRLKELLEDNEPIKNIRNNLAAGLVFLRMNERSASLAEMNRFEPEFRSVFGDTGAFKSAIGNEVNLQSNTPLLFSDESLIINVFLKKLY